MAVRSTPDRDAAASFDATAIAYELGRPEYPDEALDWWDERGAFEPGFEVLDLAAGTGKLTRLLPIHACEVTAVEPLANMRAAFEIAVPEVRVIDGTAEHIPFPDNSFDTVLVAQGFHWFDEQAALAEIARVLRPGGGLGLIWNEDDVDAADWLSSVVDSKRSVAASPTAVHDLVTEAIAANGQFEPTESVECRWVEQTTVERVLANVLSRSYVGLLEPNHRMPVLTKVREAVEHLGDVFDYPYRTSVFWTRTHRTVGQPVDGSTGESTVDWL